MRGTTQRGRSGRRFAWLWVRALPFACVFALAMNGAQAQPVQQTLIVAAYPAVDEIIKSAIPAWKKLHPTVDIKVVSRQFADHHTAMTTALSTSFYLPDVMALEVGYVGRFAQGGGLDDLSRAPYDIKRFQASWVPYALQQATNRKGAIVAAPTDTGLGQHVGAVQQRAGADVGWRRDDGALSVGGLLQCVRHPAGLETLDVVRRARQIVEPAAMRKAKARQMRIFVEGRRRRRIMGMSRALTAMQPSVGSKPSLAI